MFKKLVGNYFLNISNLFYVVLLQLLFAKYMKPFHILFIYQTIYLLHWENFHLMISILIS